MKEILVDEEGYNQFFNEIEELKNSKNTNARCGSEACQSAIGDGWHDNFEFESAQREEKSISSKIKKMSLEQKMLKIVSKTKKDPKYINIGDILKLSIKYDEEDIEIITVKLTGKYLPDIKEEVKEISLNSPLGRTIYLKKITDKLSYYVNDKIVEIRIIEKL